MNSAASLIKYYFKEINRKNCYNLGIIIFKPECPPAEISAFKEYCKRKKLTILLKRRLVLSKEAVIALYPKIFSFSKDDLRYGLKWKEQTIQYLTSGSSVCLVIKGSEAGKCLSKYKYSLRKRYGKITHPKSIMPSNEFFSRVVKNYVHVIDKSELQNCIWLLF